ncbi:MAG: two-component sensor histidine kinase [Chitinophagaceae bacterium]|jgi:signal transduction histidine kinase|nr:two-component sensor histidine kinase [Chitinophagaceae bacterium]
MNLKLRFALLFTLLVAIILSFSMAAIYYLYYNYRQEDFYRRLEQQAQQTFELHFDTRISDSVMYALSVQSGRQLYQEQDFIIDSSRKVAYQFPDTATFMADDQFLATTKEQGVQQFKYGNMEGIAKYFPHRNAFAISLAQDSVGLKKVTNLRDILTLVCIGGVILTALLSFVYVRQITKPLVRLSEQINNISESNLTQRVPISRNNDELTLIARNFNDMLNRLEKAFTVQKSFVHHASHELRTPLASMLAQTELALRQDRDTEGYKRVLESLKEDQQGLIDLTNSLLSLSQYEKIAAAGEWPKVRVDEILYETVEAARKMFADININIGFSEVPDDEDLLCVRANDALLKSAFFNLIKNAYRYSNDRKVAIAIRANADQVIITVENNGKQIPEDERSRLFIPFFRGQNAMGQKGFGLGLSIVNRIIHLHVGTVHYEAEGTDLNRFVVEFIK